MQIGSHKHTRTQASSIHLQTTDSRVSTDAILERPRLPIPANFQNAGLNLYCIEQEHRFFFFPVMAIRVSIPSSNVAVPMLQCGLQSHAATSVAPTKLTKNSSPTLQLPVGT
jgi:hypothetical protein